MELGAQLSNGSSLIYRIENVYINGECSKLKQISRRVCTGTITILNLHKRLAQYLKKLDLYPFADDTNIYYEDETLENLEKRSTKS